MEPGAATREGARPREADDTQNGARGNSAGAATDVVAQVVRNAAAEIIKGGGGPLDDVVRTVVADAIKTVEERGPGFAKQAGILNWRYATLGWITWNVGKRVIKRKTKAAVGGKTAKAPVASAT